jgi:two-component system response regulator protein
MKCITVDDDAVTRTLLGKYISQTDSLFDAGRFEDSIAAINFLETHSDISLIFLDIEMPGMDGFEFIESLDYEPLVVVISSSDRYALHAFEMGAMDYLLKPISYARFYKAVSKAMKWSRPSDWEKELFLRKDDSLVRVMFSSILWIESMENYVRVVTDTDRFVLHFTMKAVVNQMPASQFRRIHRSYIVNMSRVESIEEQGVRVRYDGGFELLPIGSSYREGLIGSLRFISSK